MFPVGVNVLLPFRIHEIVTQAPYAFPLPCISFVRFGSAGGVFLRASHSNFPTAFSLSFAVVKTVHFQTVNDVEESLANNLVCRKNENLSRNQHTRDY